MPLEILYSFGVWIPILLSPCTCCTHHFLHSARSPRITFLLPKPEVPASGVDRTGLSVSPPVEGVIDYRNWMQISERLEFQLNGIRARHLRSWAGWVRLLWYFCSLTLIINHGFGIGMLSQTRSVSDNEIILLAFPISMYGMLKIWVNY